MKTLITFISSGKGSWKKTKDVIEKNYWDKVIAITNEFGKDNFRTQKNISYKLIKKTHSVDMIKNECLHILQNTKKPYVCLHSGTGLEHTALILALHEHKNKYTLVWEEFDEIKESN